MHTTEGSEGPTSAEDGARYNQRRTDGTSAHFFVDSNSTVQGVKTTDEAHTARRHGNDVGIQIEVCGKAGQTRAQWYDKMSAGTIEQTAQLCVALRAKYGKNHFPLINLTPAQLRAGRNGFAEHFDATKAWPEDGGTHWDPGPNFPWDKLFARIAEIESGEDEDMPTTIKLTEGSADALGNYDEGDVISFNTFANLLLIYAARVGRSVQWGPGTTLGAIATGLDKLSTAFAAYAVAEELDDAEVGVALQELKAQAGQIQAAIAELETAEPVGNGETVRSVG
jgi:hypothetical protein